jgi:hypothetical protein
MENFLIVKLQLNNSGIQMVSFNEEEYAEKNKVKLTLFSASVSNDEMSVIYKYEKDATELGRG